jgi:uncharacterized protein (DUF362 family)
MKPSSLHEIYSCDATVYLVTGEDKIDTFLHTVERARFMAHLLEKWQSSAKPKEVFRIAVKPNIMTGSVYETDSPIYTNPDLVEALIKAMRGEGFRQFSVVETENVYNYAYTKRSVPAVATMCGYTGDGYDIVDLAEDTVEFDYGGVLGEHLAGRVWLGADYRISFAKNKTHWQCYYTACLKNVYGCLPEWDKMRHYHGRNIEFYHATVSIADKIPVDFGFLDAWTSGDGLAGHVRDAQPNQTRTFMASDNIYALDWVAGEKMGVDPLDNVVVREARQRWGSIHIDRVGDMAVWYPWNNVRPFVIKVLDVLEEWYWFSRVTSRSFANQMDPRFPPVSRYQWFFGSIQALSRHLASLIDKFTTKPTHPP